MSCSVPFAKLTTFPFPLITSNWKRLFEKEARVEQAFKHNSPLGVFAMVKCKRHQPAIFQNAASLIRHGDSVLLCSTHLHQSQKADEGQACRIGRLFSFKKQRIGSRQGYPQPHMKEIR